MAAQGAECGTRSPDVQHLVANFSETVGPAPASGSLCLDLSLIQFQDDLGGEPCGWRENPKHPGAHLPGEGTVRPKQKPLHQGDKREAEVTLALGDEALAHGGELKLGERMLIIRNVLVRGEQLSDAVIDLGEPYRFGQYDEAALLQNAPYLVAHPGDFEMVNQRSAENN